MEIPGSSVKFPKRMDRYKETNKTIWLKRVNDAAHIYGSDRGTYIDILLPGTDNEGLLNRIYFSEHNEGINTSNSLYEFTVYVLGSGRSVESIVSGRIWGATTVIHHNYPQVIEEEFIFHSVPNMKLSINVQFSHEFISSLKSHIYILILELMAISIRQGEYKNVHFYLIIWYEENIFLVFSN